LKPAQPHYVDIRHGHLFDRNMRRIYGTLGDGSIKVKIEVAAGFEVTFPLARVVHSALFHDYYPATTMDHHSGGAVDVKECIFANGVFEVRNSIKVDNLGQVSAGRLRMVKFVAAPEISGK
jgi:hypothetical protein